MRRILPGFLLRQAMIWTLVMTTLVVGWCPPESRAMLVPAEPTTPVSEAGLTRDQDLQTVQRVLEAKVVKQRLEALGLSAEEVNVRLQRLSDAQLHQLAMQIESLIPGGIERELGIILTVLLIILVAVVIVILV